MSARCEPPEELWNKDGFHWVEAPDGKLRILRWLCRDGATTRGWPMSAAGYRYFTPVATPTEVAALRAEVERLRGALDKIARHPWAARNPTASINERVRDMVSQIITTAATALQQPQGCVSAAPTGCVSDSECAAAGRCLERADVSAALTQEPGNEG
jgi:hypothetical protein